MSQPFFANDPDLQLALERRLDVLTRSDYHDEARRDLNRFDYLGIVLMVAVLCVGSFWWGY